MPEILQWVIGAGVILTLGGLALLYFKFAKGVKTAEDAIGLGGRVTQAVAAMLPDDVNKLDVHDVVLVVGRLLEEMPKWAADETNVTFLDVKDEILTFVDSQRGTIPQLSHIPKDVVEKVAEGVFVITKALLSLKK